eukprot:scaffold27710_cov70-Attheya_sp.AAC.1
MVVKAAVQCCNTLQKQGTDVVLLNTAVDGVSCESHFCRRQISSFLQGEFNILGLVDPNHNAKNSRYQMFGGSWASVRMGQYVLDPWILKLAGVPQEL